MQSPSVVILEPPKIVWHSSPFFPIYFPWSDGTRCLSGIYMVSSLLNFGKFGFWFLSKLLLLIACESPQCTKYSQDLISTLVSRQTSPIWNFYHRYKYDIIQSISQPIARISKKFFYQECSSRCLHVLLPHYVQMSQLKIFLLWGLLDYPKLTYCLHLFSQHFTTAFS